MRVEGAYDEWDCRRPASSDARTSNWNQLGIMAARLRASNARGGVREHAYAVNEGEPVALRQPCGRMKEELRDAEVARTPEGGRGSRRISHGGSGMSRV